MKLTFVQTPIFAAQALRLGLNDEDIRALEQLILDYPERGNVMKGTGGVRKIRFAPPSWHTGKSGAARACYVLFTEAESCYFVSIFAKSDKPNLSRKEMNILRNWVEETRKKLSGE